MLVESHNTSILSLLFYLAGIALFALSALLLPPGLADLPIPTPADAPNRLSKRHVIILVAGVVIAVVLNVLALFSLRANLQSGVGAWLWLASLVVLAATGIVLHRTFGWRPRWGEGARLSSRSRLFVIAIVVIVLVVAALARFLSRRGTVRY